MMMMVVVMVVMEIIMCGKNLSWCVAIYSSQLSLAIPPWVGAIVPAKGR